MDDSDWEKISSYKNLVHDEVVWERRIDCKLKTTPRLGAALYNIGYILNRNIFKFILALAKRFESLVEASPIFKVIYPVEWGLVCFQLESGDNNDHELLARELKLNQETLLTTSKWNGSTYLRAVFNHFTATEKDVDDVFHKIENRACLLFEKHHFYAKTESYRG